MDGLSAVSATVGILAGVGALLLATVGRMQWPRLIAALVLTSVAGILNSTFGPTAHGWATAVDGFVGQFIGRWTGTAVIGVVGLVVLAVAGFRVYQRNIDARTLVAVAAVPPTVTLIPGTLGAVAVAVVGFVPWVLSWVIALFFGLGG